MKVLQVCGRSVPTAVFYLHVCECVHTCGCILTFSFSPATGAGAGGGLGPPPLSSPGAGDHALLMRPPSVSVVWLLVWTLCHLP